MLKKIKILAQYLTPHHWLSRVMGFLAELEWRWLKNSIIHWFMRAYKVDLKEAVEDTSEAYPNFNSFFTRALKSEARPIDAEPGSLVSPADGVMSQFGTLSNDTIIQAKGHDYSMTELLGGNQEWAAPFLNGRYMTIYLAPNNYHRVHMPVYGLLEKMIYVPGRLFSVNPLTANHVPNLFARNERVISLFNCAEQPANSDAVPMAVVLVGAMVVGGIHTVWAGQVSPPHRSSKVVTQYYQNLGNATILNKGAQMGHFSVGSTVVLLMGSNTNGACAVNWLEQLQLGQSVRVGEKIGSVR